VATKNLVYSGIGRVTKPRVPQGARWFGDAKPLFIERWLEWVETAFTSAGMTDFLHLLFLDKKQSW
jgi:hypothetical protein